MVNDQGIFLEQPYLWSGNQPEAKRWRQMENAVFGFIGAIIGSVLGFIGSLLSTFGKSKDTSKDVLTRTVTNERAQWREDLRSLAGEFVENSLRIVSNDPSGSIYSLERQRVQIRLRLNPNPEHKLDANILKISRNMVQLARGCDPDNLLKSIELFEHEIQSLLKQEWDKSKREAQSGSLDVKSA